MTFRGLALVASIALASVHGCASTRARDPSANSERRKSRLARALARLPVAVAEAPQSEAEILASRSLAAALASHRLTLRDDGPLVLVRNLVRSEVYRAERILPRDGSEKFAIVTKGRFDDLCADYGDLVILAVQVTFESTSKALVTVLTMLLDKVCDSGATYTYERRSSEWILTKESFIRACDE
jgi:hypothetical protein